MRALWQMAKWRWHTAADRAHPTALANDYEWRRHRNFIVSTSSEVCHRFSSSLSPNLPYRSHFLSSQEFIHCTPYVLLWLIPVAGNFLLPLALASLAVIQPKWIPFVFWTER